MTKKDVYYSKQHFNPDNYMQNIISQMMHDLSVSQGERLKYVLRQIISSCASSPETCILLKSEGIIKQLTDIHGRESSDSYTMNLCIMAIETLRLSTANDNQQLDKQILESKVQEFEKNQKQFEKQIKQINLQLKEAELRAAIAEQKEIIAEQKAQVAENNLKEIFLNKDKIFKRMADNLSKPLQNSNELQNKQIEKEDNDLKFLIMMFEIQQDYEAKKAAIISGAIKAILHIFETRQLDCINHYCSQAFYVFTIKNSSEIDRMIVGMKPFPGLIRLLSHTNTQVLSNAISSINNIVLSGTLTTMPNIPHPHYDSIAAVDGKNQLFNFFKRNNISKLSKNQASMVIWRIFRQREMTNIEQLQYLVAYLKNSLYEDDDWIKQTSKEGLQNLAQNAKNRSEITKGGFIIPK